MKHSEEQAGLKQHWVARQPLLLGLVAAGGVGLYSVVQMVGPQQAGDADPKLANPPQQDLSAAVPAPDFGTAPAAISEAQPASVVSNPAKLAIVAAPVRAADLSQSQLPRRISLPVAAMSQSRKRRRHGGSFAVPSASERSLAASSSLTVQASSGARVPEATLVAYQPAPQTAALGASAMLAQPLLAERASEAQLTPRALVPGDQSGAAALISAPSEVAQQQSGLRIGLPEVQSGAAPAPVNAAAVPQETAATSPIVSAGSSTHRPVARLSGTSRLAMELPQDVQPSGTARIAAIKPAQPPSGALTLAAPAGMSGVEGLTGLDDSRLAAVRPILGETRQQAGSVKRRANAGSAKPTARSRNAEEAPRSPDEISAVGSGLDMHVPARINDSLIGNLPLQVAADSSMSVRLGDLLSLVGGQMDRQLFSDLQGSSAVNSHVSFAELRAAGIDLHYEAAHNQIVLKASSV